jgi:RNA polymerase sigma-70 factor (ECF subfamily)
MLKTDNLNVFESFNRETIAELYDRYGASVFTVISRIVRNDSLAEDLTQETFVRIWNRRHTFDGRLGSLGTWVMSVARHCAIDYVRSTEGRMAQSTFEITSPERGSALADWDKDVRRIDIRLMLSKALRTLTSNQRMVLDLAYTEGLSHTEIAARIERPLGTVKSWVRTALQILRAEIA